MAENKGTILVVEDTPESLRMLTAMLSSEGYEVRPADGGALALASAQAKLPELVLLDLRMPGMDGFEVCRCLKADKATASIPVIFLSAATELEERVEGFRGGAVDFISKPFQREELLARVKTHLELGRLRERLEAIVVQRTAALHVTNNQLQDELSRRHQAEEEVRALNVELSRRIEQRTADLESFSYSVSHDLRAPLRHILGFTQLLAEHEKTTDDAKAIRYAGIIVAAAQKQETLLDALISFSRAGRTDMRAEPVSIGMLVRECRSMLEAEYTERQVEWVIGDMPEAVADQALLKQAIYNLLANAIKFTRARPVARIEISAEEKAGEVVVCVRDNGVGFDMRGADKLFGVFQRLHLEDEFEGIGIGLANVKRVITRHDGRVWAEGAVDQGAAFYFALPGKAACRPA